MKIVKIIIIGDLLNTNVWYQIQTSLISNTYVSDIKYNRLWYQIRYASDTKNPSNLIIHVKDDF